jgi:hypothetical protein
VRRRRVDLKNHALGSAGFAGQCDFVLSNGNSPERLLFTKMPPELRPRGRTIGRLAPDGGQKSPRCFAAPSILVCYRIWSEILFDFLLVLVLSAHLLAANVAAAAPLVSLALDWRESRLGDRLAGEVGRWLLRLSLSGLAVAMALGGVSLGIDWLTDWDRFSSAAGRIAPSRYWWALPELALYVVCLIAYLMLWKPGKAHTRRAIWLRRTLGLVAATNLAYHFPLLFIAIGVYSTRALSETINFRAALVDPEIVSQVVHHLLASVAVVGVAIMGCALLMERAGRPTEDVRRVAIWGGRVALAPTLLQWLAGLYVLVELPERSRAGLLGGDVLGSCLFGGALVAVIVLMHRLAGVAFGETERRNLIGSMALMALVVVTMVGARHRARQEMIIVATRGAVPLTVN